MANQNAAQNNKLQVTEFISVSELANLMDVELRRSDLQVYEPGHHGIHQPAPRRGEVTELVAGEFGYEVEFRFRRCNT